jgi:hypothetical protein
MRLSNKARLKCDYQSSNTHPKNVIKMWLSNNGTSSCQHWSRGGSGTQKSTARCKLSGHLHAGTTSAKQAPSKDSPLCRRRACSAGRERHECSDARSPEAPPQVGCKIAAGAAGCGTDVQVLSDRKSQQEREQMAGDTHSRNIGDTQIT